MGARAVYEVAGINEHLQRVLVDLDLNEPQTILELETIYATFRAKKAEENARKRSAKR